MEKPILQDSPSFVDLCTLHQHAMRYYRLWIYACNTVLAVSTLVFTVFAVSVLVDPRITLLSGVELYQPTFLYAYVALLLQCGVLQAIGCVGALRLNQRLLNTYWTLLLVLMIGDILVGLVWAFRLDQIKSNLRPMLKQKLVALYGKDEDFTEVWDWVQTNDMCCGVDGPIDFQRINESTFGTFDTNGLANDTWATYLLRQQEMKLLQQQQNQQTIPKLPSTCCVFTVTPVTTTEPPLDVPGGGGGGRHSHHGYSKNRGNGSSNNNNSKGDRWNTNDPSNTKQGYFQPPQQLKGSFHINSNPYFPESTNNLSSSSSSILVTSRSSIITGSSPIISNLRQYPLTDPVSAAASGYFGPGAVPPAPPQPLPMGSVHNRRKISHAKNKHLDEYGYAERNRFGSRQMTTTESPGGGRPPPITIGVCVLPTHLRQTSPASRSGGSSGSVSSSSNSNDNSMERGSGSFEDMSGSSEYFSSTPIPPPSSSTSTTTAESSSPPSYSSSTEPPSSASTPTSSSTNSQSNRGSSNRPPYPYPFVVSMAQHGEGCGDKILEWVEHSSDVLFVIGFCIIVFLKGCFIAILRYEIKEMIEKIKLLNGEDAGRTAAMNELIGLTSMYESGNDDSGEREGLMSGVHGTNADTSNTNVDTIDGDNASAIPSSIGTTISRKDSIHFVKENHLVGNNVPPSRYIGNHIGGVVLPATSPCTNNNPGGGDDYPRVLAVTRETLDNANANTPITTNNKHEIEEDFDSGSALLGNKLSTNESPVGNNKYYQHHHHYHHHHHLQYPHRNENGGRSLPRNGNNNNAVTIENPPIVGVPSSQSAPLPIDAIARVTNTPIH